MFETALAAGICSMGADVMLMRPAAHAGHRVHHLVDARRRRHRDQRVAQPVPGQRHQDLRAPTASSCPTRSRPRSSGCMEAIASSTRSARARRRRSARPCKHRGRARPLRRVLQARLPAATSRSTACKIVVDCAQRRRLPRRAGGVRGARRRRHRDRRQARRHEHQRRLRRAASRGDGARRCGSTGAHLGIALDGDADRVILVDEHGNVVDGDAVMALCATRMLERRRAAKQDAGRDRDVEPRPRARAARRAGGSCVRTQVGDRYVVEEMRKQRLQLRRRAVGPPRVPRPRDDRRRHRRRAAVLAVMVREGRPLSELAAGDDALPAGAGEPRGRAQASRSTSCPTCSSSSPRSSASSATTAACWCATRAPRPRRA